MIQTFQTIIIIMRENYNQHRIKIGCFNVNMFRKSGTKVTCVKSARSELKTKPIVFLLLLSYFLVKSIVPLVNSCLQSAVLTSNNFETPGQSLQTITSVCMSSLLVPSPIAFLLLLFNEPSPHSSIRDQDNLHNCEP